MFKDSFNSSANLSTPCSILRLCQIVESLCKTRLFGLRSLEENKFVSYFSLLIQFVSQISKVFVRFHAFVIIKVRLYGVKYTTNQEYWQVNFDSIFTNYGQLRIKMLIQDCNVSLTNNNVLHIFLDYILSLTA